MSKKIDLRVIRTKKAIKQSLIHLMKEKSFDEITVKDITTEADINRGTFYVHYKDKHELMKECQKDIMQGMSKIAEQKLQQTALKDQEHVGAKAHSSAITIFEFLNENKVMMKALLGPKGDLTFQTRLRDFLWKTIMEDKEHEPHKEKELPVPGEYIASYIAFAHIGVIQKWLENDSKESPQEMARILSTINMQGPFAAIGLQKP